MVDFFTTFHPKLPVCLSVCMSNPPLACLYLCIYCETLNVQRWDDPTDIGFVRRFLGTDAANSYVTQAVYTKEEVRDRGNGRDE